MRLYRIDASVTLYVRAESRAEANAALADLGENLDEPGESLRVRSARIRRIKYPMPKGAGAWAPALREMRWRERQHISVGTALGSWWLTDGVVMLRCDGPCAPARGGRVIPSKHLRAVATTARAAKCEAIWRTHDEGRMLRSGDVGVNPAFVQMVRQTYPTAKWWTSGPLEPIAAKVRGRLVAVVMPMRLTEEVP